jgi:hypothetical protein
LAKRSCVPPHLDSCSPPARAARHVIHARSPTAPPTMPPTPPTASMARKVSTAVGGPVTEFQKHDTDRYPSSDIGAAHPSAPPAMNRQEGGPFLALRSAFVGGEYGLVSMSCPGVARFCGTRQCSRRGSRTMASGLPRAGHARDNIVSDASSPVLVQAQGPNLMAQQVQVQPAGAPAT